MTAGIKTEGINRVGDFIAHICDEFPEHFIFRDYSRGERYTYTEWGQDGDILARELQAQGFEPGDFVLMRFGNNYGYLAAYGGISRAEGVAAPVALRLTGRELTRVLDLVKPKWYLADLPEWKESREAVAASTVAHIGLWTGTGWEWKNNDPRGEARRPDLGLAHLRFTSGSQGEPKAVALTQANMLCRVGCPGHYAAAGDVFFLGIPFVFRPDRLILALSVGAEIVVEESVHPRQIVRCWQETGVTFAWLVPTLIGLLIQLEEQEIPEKLALRGINTGGAYLYRQWEEKFESLFHVPVYQQYGLSEGCVAFENPLIKKTGSVGRPAPLVEAKICDSLGRELPYGQIGELWYRGANVMRGYLDRPDLTAAALRDGWLRTGDLARFDRDRYLFIEGRIKDLIHSGGLKFSPREVEDVLLSYPGIKEAAVVGVPHQTKGEVSKAYFVANRSIRQTELREFCRQHLADYKIPRAWEQVESLPKLSSGKIARRSVGQR